VRTSLGLPDDVDPFRDRKLNPFSNSSLGGLYSASPAPRVLDALATPAVSALAFADDHDSAPVTAMRIAADPSDIRADLLALGFVDRDGVLEGPNGKRATGVKPIQGEVEVISTGESETEPSGSPHHGLAIRFIDDTLFLSADADALRGLPATPADRLPLDVQSMLDGDATWALGPGDCLLGSGIAMDADGSGELVYVVDGRPDADAFTGAISSELGDPEIDGNVLTVPVDVGRPLSPQDPSPSFSLATSASSPADPVRFRNPMGAVPRSHGPLGPRRPRLNRRVPFPAARSAPHRSCGANRAPCRAGPPAPW
jgi:hypothetical protein